MMTDREIAATFGRLPALVNGNAALVRRGRFLSTVFLVGAGDHDIYVTVRNGLIDEAAIGPATMRSWCFAIRASADAWQRFWEPVPRPGFHDLLAMMRFGVARIEGDLQPLMANLRYVKDVLEAPRGRTEGRNHAA